MTNKPEIVVIGDGTLDVSAWPEEEKQRLAEQIRSGANPVKLYDPESGKHFTHRVET